MTTTIAGLTLNNPDNPTGATITSERVSKTASLDPITPTDSDSDSVEVVDINSPIRVISITGQVVGNSSVLSAFASFIWSIINGQQFSTVEYISELHGTIDVKIDEFTPTDESGKTRIMKYTLKLIESV